VKASTAYKPGAGSEPACGRLVRRLCWPPAVWVIVTLYTAGLVLGSVLQPGSKLASGWDTAITPSLQNVLHFPCYAGLALLLTQALWSTGGRQAWYVPLAAVLTMLMGLVLEGVQAYIPGRTASLADAVVNGFGAAFAGLAMQLIADRGLLPRLHRSRAIYAVAQATFLFVALPVYFWVSYVEDGNSTWLRIATFLTFVQGVCIIGSIYKLFRWQAISWLPNYLICCGETIDKANKLHVCIAVMDHYEPCHGHADVATQLDRVNAWQERYAAAVEGMVDSDGQPPQHTWFVPVGLVAPEVLPVMAQWPARGWGEIEYHLHHDEEPGIATAELENRVRPELSLLQSHGAIPNGRYGFVHGMFALAGGNPKYCQVNDELDLLQRTGCYADFTFPALGSRAQPRQVNSIYRARSTGGVKPYDHGVPARAGSPGGQGLLMIPGPLSIQFNRAMLNDADLAPNTTITASMIRRWIRSHVHVQGRPEWVFVILHTHSATEVYQKALFEDKLPQVWRLALQMASQGEFCLHYMTAREIYNVVKAAEAGHSGDPGCYRDFEISSPNLMQLSPKSKQAITND